MTVDFNQVGVPLCPPPGTKKRLPVELVFTETYDRIVDAIARERQIKGWSRAKKEALIAHYEALPELARNRRRTVYVRRWPPSK